MRLMFVYHCYNDAGSAQDLHNYIRVARTLGHEVAIYGVDPKSLFKLSKDVASADAIVFIFEWTTQLRYGDRLDLARMVASVPRRRRVVIDCDGGYNDAISVGGDYNHKDAEASRRWMDVCESLSDKLCQPTLHPLQPNVRPFFFHAYDPEWEVPLDLSAKEYGMVYVGHSKFRWCPMKCVLRAIEPVQRLVGRIGFVGHGWDQMPSWAPQMKIEDHYYTDQAYLNQMKVEFIQPVPYQEVISWMSKGVFSPVIYRPLFDHLRLVTCRTFETPAANTIPLFGMDDKYVREIYGECALELVLPQEYPEEKIVDFVKRPAHYAKLIRAIRKHLAERHSYPARLRQLIEMVES
jgi:hypothetical protein